MSDDDQVWKRTLSTDPANRTGVIKVVEQYCQSLPMTTAYELCIQPEEETRLLAQNSLMWAWNAEAGKAQGHSADYQHGLWKLTILLPLQKGWKRTARRALRIQDVIDYLPDHKLRVFYAYDAVRSKGLGVKRFAEGLNAYKQYYEDQGIFLRSRQDLINEALGEQYGDAA